LDFCWNQPAGGLVKGQGGGKKRYTHTQREREETQLRKENVIVCLRSR
jgi:hypothetical protein